MHGLSWEKEASRCWDTLKIRITVFQNLENPLTLLCNLFLNSVVNQNRKLLIYTSLFAIGLTFPFHKENPFYCKTSFPSKPRYQVPLDTSWNSLQTLLSWSCVLSISPEHTNPHLHTVALIWPWYCSWGELNFLGWISFCFGLAGSR